MTVKLGDRKLKFAVFGTGWWSKFQIPAWLEIGDIELVALYNRTLSKAQKAAEKYGVTRVYDDPEELLSNEEIDFMDIITEVPAHAHLTKLGARYKVPVVCQKPMGPDYKTCLEMVEACNHAGVPLYINENYRWQPTVRLIKKLLEEGRIGRPVRANIQLSTGGVEQLQNQPFLKTLRHYALFDVGSHLFDMARYLFGEPDRLYCQGLRSVDWICGDDFSSAVLTFKDLLCTCEVVDYCPAKIFVEGTKGALECKPDCTVNLITKQGVEKIDCELWGNHDWISEEDLNILGPDCVQGIVDCQKNIIASLRYGTPAESMAFDNIKTMKLVFSAVRSVLSGESILLDLG